ncbi:hypothetical protein CHLNCDRAFT_136844 [Chlorella variabilis]|uniref:LMBR1-like membrane protein n=1 Tax=Chlorella variabilis TaxID=554065 RepID=E1ZL65_CHLVA|nr:hypothetical protein CHLNCDRAFT_136844 [Chlorella variabilis]EFN53506.1 hypothetical protein CHLNCDRAFT_136844 [Chlorella variabilis]|eukprot:XP_005845608.1 hypothetical protein CHLNCDRAFT_136844 [Chlorella variabilis]
MLFFTVVALPSVICGVAAALVWLPSRTTGWLVRLDVGLAWFAALATLILVPTDVAAALSQQDPGPLAVWWRAAYWYGFSVQVLVLPLHMEFARSGEFSIKDRLLAAARYNLLYYAVLLAVALAGLLLLLFSGRLQPANVIGFCIASSNAYGLVAAIFLLGFGLWAVPRALWNSADRRGEQRRVYHKAGLQAERAQAAHRRLSAAVLTVRRASVLFAAHDPLRPLMDVVLGLAASVGPSFKLDAGVQVPDEAELDVFDRADLARLRRELKAAMKDWEREHALYLEAVQEHLNLEEVVGRLEAGVPQGAPALDRMRWLLLAALAALCSLAIVVAEATIAWTLPNLSVVSAVLRSAAGSRFATELLCFLFLAYPCACAYYSLYRLGRFAFYRMVPRHTDAYSLCFSALLMCRFAAPLAFNFMAAIAMPETKGHGTPDVTSTVFYSEFGQLMMRQPLIGWQFTTFAPVLLVPWVLLLASGVFGHLMALFKRGDALEFEDEWQNDGCAAAGRRLLLLESENVRNGLPPGLTVEPAAAGGGGGGGGGSAHVAAAAGAATGLLGTLRSAAAAAAAERAASRAGGAWWRRLLPGGGAGAGGGGAGGDDSELRLSSEAQAARGRLSRLVAQPGGGGGRAAAGYSSLPSEAPPSRPLRAAAGGGESTGAGGGGGDPFAGSPPFPPAAAGGIKAARAKFLAGAAAPPPPGQLQQRGSVDVEASGGGGASSGAAGED